jgi:glyoxylase-like metal-dependent hydrolase (beta-lactamase superfamily II)
MIIHPLSEGSFTVDHTKRFVPFNADEHQLSNRPAGSLLVEIQPFVVITSKDIILLDAGLGFQTATGTLQLHENLLKHNINPMEVTKVLMSHLHKDHAGGMGIRDEHTGAVRPAFPLATYYVNAREMDMALASTSSSYRPEELAVLNQVERLERMDGEGWIDGYINYAWSGGHCPFHQVFRIEEQGETIFYGGDEAPQYQQMKSRFVAKYDADGKRAMELRQQWWTEGKDWTFLFYHDIKTPGASPARPQA